MDRGTSTVARRRRRGPPLPGRAPHGHCRGWLGCRQGVRRNVLRLLSRQGPARGASRSSCCGRTSRRTSWGSWSVASPAPGCAPCAGRGARPRATAAALPLLVLSDFSFSAFCADGAMAGVRRIPLPSREMAVGVRCVGSFHGWLVGVQLNKGRYFGDGRCFLMNAFYQDVVRLPPPSVNTHSLDAYSKSLPIANGSGAVQCTVNDAQY